MNNLRVNCGCGRQMSIDGRLGRGAFRCGCGARIQVNEPLTVSERCSFVKMGVHCDTIALAKEPVPLCKEHAGTLKAHYIGFVGEQGLTADEADLLIAAWLQQTGGSNADSQIFLQSRSAAHADLDQRVARRSDREANGVVYYIRFGDRVKIGTTVNLPQRLTSIPYDEVMATEPGGPRVERQRHKQFARCRLTGEWFGLSPELRRHIGALAKDSQ